MSLQLQDFKKGNNFISLYLGLPQHMCRMLCTVYDRCVYVFRIPQTEWTVNISRHNIPSLGRPLAKSGCPCKVLFAEKNLTS